MEGRGIPADFSVDEIQDLLYDIMDALSDGTQPVEEGRERLAAVLARDGAKRAPSGYSEGEMTAIMEALSDGGRYNHTYDGRPVLVRMAPDEIRKLFRK